MMKLLLILLALTTVACKTTPNEEAKVVSTQSIPTKVVEDVPEIRKPSPPKIIRDYFVVVHKYTTLRKCVQLEYSKHGNINPPRWYSKNECRNDIASFNRRISGELRAYHVAIENGYDEYKKFRIVAHPSIGFCGIAKMTARKLAPLHYLGGLRPTCYKSGDALFILIHKKTLSIYTYSFHSDEEKLLKSLIGKNEVISW